MAKHVEILARTSALKIVVDGHEVKDVLAYKLEEDENGTRLTVTIEVVESLDFGVQR